jgi:hypothetical protein
MGIEWPRAFGSGQVVEKEGVGGALQHDVKSARRGCGPVKRVGDRQAPARCSDTTPVTATESPRDRRNGERSR